jgi:uncharacterized FlaG/YvyC family protein
VLGGKAMKISLEPPNDPGTANPTAPSNTRTTQAFSSTAKSPVKESANDATPAINPVVNAEQPSVTFRRDASGRIYYVVSDAKSGNELEEVPSESVRNVAEAIGQYLTAETRTHRSLNTKG